MTSALLPGRRARWSAWDVTVDDIQTALAHNRRPVQAGHPRALAGVLNLVGLASDHAESRDMAWLIDEMGRHRPSRTVLVHLSDACDNMNGTVVSDYLPLPGGNELVMELVEVEVPATRAAGLASVVGPLLRRDLPTVLWIPRAPLLDGPGLALDPLVDRLVTESGKDAAGPAASLERLAAKVETGRLPTTDLAWAALTPWRQLLGHVIDAPALESIRELGARVTVLHGGSAAPPEALLLRGWLAGTMGARSEIHLEADPGRHEPLTGLTALGAARGRHLRITTPPGRPGALVRVTEPNGETRERMLPLPESERALLLVGELELMRRDPVFEAALCRAVERTPS